MVATLHMYVEVHWYCIEPIDPTLVHTHQHLVCDTNSYKVMDITVKKYGYQMQTNKCNDLINKHTYTYCICAKSELATTKTFGL